MKIQFSKSDQQLFAETSHDYNPLHLEESYARNTFLGRPVVYGMLSVLQALRVALKGRAVQLTSIKGQFAAPLFLNTEYEFSIKQNRDQIQVKIHRNQYLKSKIRFSYEPLAQQKSNSKNESKGDYVPDWNAFERLLADDLSIPKEQLTAFLWSSYVVGMKHPGEPALFSGFELDFEPSQAASFSTAPLNVQYNPKYRHVTVNTTGTGLSRVHLEAFSRPPRIENTGDLRSSKKIESLQEKLVFISGAARGFGAALVTAFGQAGADLLLNYRNQSKGSGVESALKENKINYQLACGDVARPDHWERMLSNTSRPIDYAVLNAFPHIPSAHFLEQTPTEICDFISKSVELTVQSFHALFGHMSQSGNFVVISTIYTQTPEREFSHYVAAKSAVEGLTRSLALEFPQHRFFLVRPQKMLTDQTNTPFVGAPLKSTGEVAQALVTALAQNQSEQNLVELNLS